MSEDALPLFVETTIHIWRLTLSSSVRKRIEQVLQQHRPVSSTYVKAEYINTYLRAAITVHNLIVDSDNLDDAHRRWQGAFSKRVKLEVHHMMTVMMQGEQDKAAVLRRLRHLIETTILLYFDETVTEIFDATRCDAANVRPIRDGEAYELPFVFPLEDASEGLRGFLSRKHQQISDVEATIHSNAEHWKSVKASLGKILNGEYALGIRAWEKISDIVIALEAQDCESEIYTGNLKHFEPVCASLQLPFKPEHPS